MSLWNKCFGKGQPSKRSASRICLVCGSEVDPLVNTCSRCGQALTALSGDDKLDILSQQHRAYEHADRGRTLMAEGKFNEAECEARKAIDLVPNQSLAHSNLGMVLLAKKDVEGAIECLEHALRLNPHNSTASKYLAMAKAAKRDWD